MEIDVKKILIADDEPGVLMLVSATLGEDQRYRVLLAKDGDEALKIARREKPDLLFLDIMMPKRDGYAVCQALKSEVATAGIKVIILTARVQEADHKKAAEVGADDYMTKPFSPTALLRKVEDMLTLK